MWPREGWSHAVHELLDDFEVADIEGIDEPTIAQVRSHPLVSDVGLTG